MHDCVLSTHFMKMNGKYTPPTLFHTMNFEALKQKAF